LIAKKGRGEKAGDLVYLLMSLTVRDPWGQSPKLPVRVFDFRGVVRPSQLEGGIWPIQGVTTL